MKKDLLKVLNHTIIYGLGKSSLQIVGFILLPLYTRFLTPSDYGILSLVNFFTGFFLAIFVLGTSTSVFRYYLESDDSILKQKACYSSLLLVSVWSSIILVLLFPFKNFISFLLFDTDIYGAYVMLGLCTTALGAISSIPMFIIRAEDKAGLFISNNLIRMFLRVGLGITFVVALKRAALGALEASFITALIFTIYLLLHRIRKTDFSFSFEVLIRMLKYGFPLVVHGIGWVIMNASDKFILKEYSNLEQVGIYSVGHTLGYGVMIIIGSFGNAWPQMMFAYDKKKDASKFYGKTLTYYVAILGLVWVGITLFSKDIVMLMTHEKFWDGHQVISLIALAYIIHGAFNITSSGIYTKAKTHIEFILTPLTVCLCILLNFFFISKWGMMGAAWATLFSFSFQFLLYTVMANKYVKINFEWGVLFRIILLIVAIVSLSSVIPDFQIWINIFIKASLLFSVLMIYYSPYYFRREAVIIINRINNKK